MQLRPHPLPIRGFGIGLVLGSVLLASCSRGEGTGGDGGPVAPDRRLLVVGWDGATFDLIDPMIAAGRLPNLAALEARGASARLASTRIPISSAAWVAAVTGKGPGESGVYSFFEPVEGSYDVRLISSRSVRATPLWRVLSAHGIGVNVVGVPITYPPEPVDGTLIAGMLSPFDADYAWPPGTADRLRARGFEPDLGIWRASSGATPKRLEDQLRIKRELMLELLADDDWAFTMVVFKCLDVVSHAVYDGDPDGPILPGLLERLDAILGDMVAAVGPDTNVLVVSDHGFAAYPRAFNLHEWLVEEGFSAAREPGTPDVVAPDDAPLAERRPAEHAERLARLELSKTSALAGACEGNFGSLDLNLAGREPEGLVRPEEADEILATLASRLEAARFGGDGERVVTRVWRGAELYPGPSPVVPDLVFETTSDVHVVSSLDLPVWFEHGETRFPDHALHGILVAAGPDFARVETRGEASILDLAPTALALLDQPVYVEMEGEVLESLFAGPVDVRRIAESADPLRAPPVDPAGGFTQEDLEEVQTRLKTLGYVE